MLFPFTCDGYIIYIYIIYTIYGNNTHTIMYSHHHQLEITNKKTKTKYKFKNQKTIADLPYFDTRLIIVEDRFLFPENK